MKRFAKGRISTLAALALVGGIAAAIPMPAAAMEEASVINCLPHHDLTRYLDRAYGEDRIAVAENELGHEVQLFASRRGTWTLVEKRPDGQGCIQASGKRLRVERDSLPKRPPAML